MSRRAVLAIASAHLWATAESTIELEAGSTPSYNPDDAILHARLSVAAYCGLPHSSDASLRNWECGPACNDVSGMSNVIPVGSPNHDDAYGYVGKLDGYCVVAFRGTSNLAGWIQDLKAGLKTNLNKNGIPCQFDGSDCKAGTGFYQNYRNMKPQILGNLSAIGCSGKSLLITGHSLGAAVAVIAMWDLGQNEGFTIKPTYTIAGPRVGNTAFAGAFNQAYGKNIQRLTHYYDPVPHLPPHSLGFDHVTQESWFEESWGDGHTTCAGSSGEDDNCADQFWDVPQMIADCLAGQIVRGNCDHLTYFNDGFLGYEMDGESCSDQLRSKVLV